MDSFPNKIEQGYNANETHLFTIPVTVEIAEEHYCGYCRFVREYDMADGFRCVLFNKEILCTGTGYHPHDLHRLPECQIAEQESIK